MTAREREFESIDAALNPARSAVVEACAGSGKTWLLVSRIVRSLLAGAAPSEILAITFTRNGAVEMAERLRQWLRLLALAPDEEAAAFLEARGLSGPQSKQALPRARHLFEEFLTAEPPLAITTFHGWFLQLLRRAPFASAAHGDEELIEQTSELIDAAWRRFAAALAREPQGETALAFEQLARDYGMKNTRDLLNRFLGKRAEWWAYTRGHRDPLSFALARLLDELDVDPQFDVAGELFSDAIFVSDLTLLASVLARGSPTSKGYAADITDALATGARAFPRVERVFFTVEEGDRVSVRNYAVRSGIGQTYETLCKRLRAACVIRREQAIYRCNRAALRCGSELLRHYCDVKRERNAMDYIDIEWRAYLLLNHSDHAEYMQYKLDARFRHILLDEFQDTNPLQWQVLSAWLGASAAVDAPPGVFQVGDPKQAIYRFRRADSRLFDVAADFFASAYEARRLSNNLSWRNAPAILELVNRVFGDEPEFAPFTAHSAHHANLPGRIEILPLADTPEPVASSQSPPGLRNPLLQARIQIEDVRRDLEGQCLAEKIKAIVGHWDIATPAGARAARFSDILVLVRKRTHLAVYQRALRDASIPYIGARRGGLLESLEASDVTALLQFLSAPYSDLALAQALRSPIFACSDLDLMAIAGQPGASWHQRIATMVAGGPVSAALQRAHELLGRWLAVTDTKPVHDLLDAIYFEADLTHRYRQTVPAAMGAAVEANLNAFMEAALAIDAGRYPSLPGFLDTLKALRESEQQAPDEGAIDAAELDAIDAVRIMTIHGAKGLESPIVWLLDGNAQEQPATSYDALVNWPVDNSRPLHFSMYTVKADRGSRRNVHFASDSAAAAREELNLLYVAITRARQAFLVSGIVEKKPREGGTTWYARLRRAVAVLTGETDDSKATIAFGQDLAAIATGAVAAVEEPEEVFTVACPPAPTGGRVDGEFGRARRFGVMLHGLVEFLSDAPQSVEREALRRKLGAAPAEFEQLWQRARGIIDAPDLARFFNRDHYLAAHNELTYLAPDGEARRIDRLVEFDDSVWILDYKAAGFSSLDQDLERVASYREQLRAYRNAMGEIYPRKKVRAALILADATLHESVD